MLAQVFFEMTQVLKEKEVLYFLFLSSFFPKTYIISKKTHINKGIFENDVGFGKINKLSSFFSFFPQNLCHFKKKLTFTYVSFKMTQISKNKNKLLIFFSFSLFCPQNLSFFFEKIELLIFQFLFSKNYLNVGFFKSDVGFERKK